MLRLRFGWWLWRSLLITFLFSVWANTGVFVELSPLSPIKSYTNFPAYGLFEKVCRKGLSGALISNMGINSCGNSSILRKIEKWGKNSVFLRYFPKFLRIQEFPQILMLIFKISAPENPYVHTFSNNPYAGKFVHVLMGDRGDNATKTPVFAQTENRKVINSERHNHHPNRSLST